MEKDLKEKKPEEQNTPKVPWTKLVPAAAVIAALVFSGIKAKGSDGKTEAVQKAETTVMSADELEKYLGYEEENTVSDSTPAADKKTSAAKKNTSKSSSKKSTKKTAAKKSSGKRNVSESAKNNASATGQGSTQTPVASVPANGYKDGSYEGSGTGFGGTIRVRVTISGGKITAIDILDASGETASYFASAQGVISRMIAGNTPNVDAVSGATYSSNGIIQAVQNALSQAAADGSSQQVTPAPAVTSTPAPTLTPKPSKTPSPTKKPEDPNSPKKYLDGKYKASAKGYSGDVKVTVTIKNGVIRSVKQENTDTPMFFEKAWSVLEEQLVGADSVDDIDTVSGATYSSKGILSAVKKALKEAKNPEYGKTPTPTPTKKPTQKPTAAPKPTETPEPTAAPEPTETPEPTATPVPEDPNVTPTPGTDDPTVTPEPTEAPEQTGMYRDGTYTAYSYGYNGKVTLTVTISGGQIVSIEQTNSDNTEFFTPAWETIYPQIMANQSADGIDTVSGATFSSEGILGAAQNALAQAKN